MIEEGIGSKEEIKGFTIKETTLNPSWLKAIRRAPLKTSKSEHAYIEELTQRTGELINSALKNEIEKGESVIVFCTDKNIHIYNTLTKNYFSLSPNQFSRRTAVRTDAVNGSGSISVSASKFDSFYYIDFGDFSRGVPFTLDDNPWLFTVNLQKGNYESNVLLGQNKKGNPIAISHLKPAYTH